MPTPRVKKTSTATTKDKSGNKELKTREKKEEKESSEEVLYSVGDYLVYPMHGVGQINSVSKQVILGKRKQCYVLELNSSKMKVMIPVDKAQEIGIRPIIKKKDVKKVLDL